MIKLILGGPSYRMEVDARHSASLVPFALRCAMPRMVQKKAFGGKLRDIVTPSPISILAAHYQHGTPVAVARNGIFKEALEANEATHIMMLDSDCSIPMDQCDPIIRCLLSLGDRPMFGVPAPQRDRRANVWESREVKMTRLPLDGELHECFAVGFGCVVFNLAWYRANWPKAPWFLDGWDEEFGPMGEDYKHSRDLAARVRGGLGAEPDPTSVPLFAGAYVDHHDRGEGKTLRPEAADSAVAR